MTEIYIEPEYLCFVAEEFQLIFSHQNIINYGHQCIFYWSSIGETEEDLHHEFFAFQEVPSHLPHSSSFSDRYYLIQNSISLAPVHGQTDIPTGFLILLFSWVQKLFFSGSTSSSYDPLKLMLSFSLIMTVRIRKWLKLKKANALLSF